MVTTNSERPATPVAVNSDISGSTGPPFRSLEAVAAAGFSHVTWGHHWDTDFLYSQHERAAIAEALERLGLNVVDLHGTSGVEKCWYSPAEYERRAGVELVRNRIAMAAELGADAVVLHPMVSDPDFLEIERERGAESLREIEEYAREQGVAIALENLFAGERTHRFDLALQNLDTIEYYLGRFDPEYLGFCWDTGHCFILGRTALERCAQIARERLRALHLNDNRGDKDQHSAPMTWHRDWDLIAEAIAESPYPVGKPLAVEVDALQNGPEETGFLLDVREKSAAFAALYDRASAACAARAARE